MLDIIDINKIKNNNGIKKINQDYIFKLKKSIENYGQIRPIVVDNNYNIIDGHILYSLLKDMNFKNVFVKIINNSNYSNKQIYLELNTLNSEFNILDFIKIIRDDVNKHDNLLNFTEDELLNLINLIHPTKYKKCKTNNSLFE